MTEKPALRLANSGDKPLDKPHQHNMFGSQPQMSIVTAHTEAAAPLGRAPNQLTMAFPVPQLTKAEVDEMWDMMVTYQCLGG
jgi:hypothetical protein